MRKFAAALAFIMALCASGCNSETDSEISLSVTQGSAVRVESEEQLNGFSTNHAGEFNGKLGDICRRYVKFLGHQQTAKHASFSRQRSKRRKLRVSRRERQAGCFA